MSVCSNVRKMVMKAARKLATSVDIWPDQELVGQYISKDLWELLKDIEGLVT